MSQPTRPIRPRRHWFSYRLRSLLAFITVVSIGLAWVASERRQSQHELRIAQQLEARGISVQLACLFDVPRDRWYFEIVGGVPAPKQSWWRTVFGQLLGPRVQHIDAIDLDPPLTDLTSFAELKSLEWFVLECDPSVGESDDATLKAYPQILDLAPLAGLKNLEFLGLEGMPVGDLSPLLALKKLNYLGLRDNNTVRDISPLAGLENLEDIFLDGNPISDLSPLAALAKLESLDFSRTNVTDLRPLAALKSLRILSLDESQVNDLTPLASCKNLASVGIRGAPVSDEQVQLLQEALPNCQIDR